jgi:antitoxin HigA-1
MTRELEILKGIHPGLVLERKLKERGIKKGQLALTIREYPQTLTAITKGRRSMNIALALKLEATLDLEEGYFMILQVFYDIKQEKKSQHRDTPDLKQFRPALFWDTDIKKIDWDRQYKAIIQRTFERGSLSEKKELTRFYGASKIRRVLRNQQKRKDAS